MEAAPTPAEDDVAGARAKSRRDAKPPPGTPVPATRRMSVVAQDPGFVRSGRILMTELDVPAEDLLPGPIGYRVQVVDYDSSNGDYHGAHQLPDEGHEPASWTEGRPSLVKDRRFHAQNVYALVMKTLARFEFALGRRIGWSFDRHQIKVAPNGMLDANAFYSRADEGLVFGWFHGARGDRVHTCLSQDIVVHETTHALLDALRERYLDPSGPDQAAFHEGYADVVALLSVFAQTTLVEELLRRGPIKKRQRRYIGYAAVSAAALRKSALFELAEQMGSALQLGRAEALRRSVDIPADASWRAQPEFAEPHRRGEILVAAVMNGFIEAWTWRLKQAQTPGQTMHSIRRVAEEGCEIASALLTMWIRALDYMPPVHLEFGDALSAALTADLEVRPDDRRFELRDHVRRSFANYDIQPTSKLAGGYWDRAPEGLRYERVRFESMRTDKNEVFRFLWDNREKLEVRPGAYTEVLSVRPCVRVGLDGFVLRETVAEFYQVAHMTPGELRARKIEFPLELEQALRHEWNADAARRRGADPDVDAGDDRDEVDSLVPVYGGGALIFDEYGKLKYRVHNDVFGKRQGPRLQYLFEAGLLRADRDRARLVATRLSTLHRQRAIQARRFPEPIW
jgi:hypothetical protein